MENLQLNQFKWKGNFWFSITERYITGGCALLPKDIHFTLSFHENNPNINFHITKNSNPSDKPKLVIFEIPKSDLEKCIPSLVGNIMSGFIQKVDYCDLNARDYYSLCIASLEANNEFFRNILSDAVGDKIALKKSGRAEYAGELEYDLTSALSDQRIREFIENEEAGIRIQTGVRIGRQLLFKNDGSLYGFTSNDGAIYRIRMDLNLQRFILLLIDKATIRMINNKITASIKILNGLQTLAESIPYSQPILLRLLSENRGTR